MPPAMRYCESLKIVEENFVTQQITHLRKDISIRLHYRGELITGLEICGCLCPAIAACAAQGGHC